MSEILLSKGPGVPFPPPFLLVGGFVIGLGIHRFVPLVLVSASFETILNVVQFALFSLGALIASWALIAFFQARTAIIPHRPASQLVVGGPFQFSRNPMYVGLIAIYLGLTLWANSLWPLMMLPLSIWALWKLVILKEETYLTAEFGEEYVMYQSRVRRWL